MDEEAENGFVRQFSDDAPNIEQSLLREAKLAEVRAAIESLAPKQKAAVLMHKYQEMDYAQIAAVLGASESGVKSLLFRAYETLRARLAHMA
ncbi:MAG TPA: sigma-70 family RNA polymerase sigma factor [Bryobacteraceae bacterium]|nr:sigma-70 family RNA polymerase sigma factor [Bryobacteraceae bacterium]